MIEIITGLPGNGKTLYALKYVKEWAQKDKRPVFYDGIELGEELSATWTKIDAVKWFECPPGAIIVIDECQRIFRPRSLGAQPPDYVAKLETHRHMGVDLVLITQHPLLADASIRRLAGRHKHCIRKWGTQSSTIHEWPSVRDNCDKSAGRRDSVKHPWKFDKKIYQLYKSAEIHTVKRTVPMRVWMLLCVPFVLAALAWIAWYFVIGKKHLPETVQASPGQVAQAAGSVVPGQYREKQKWEDPLADARRYAYEGTPRVAGLAHTAPKYDSVTAPTTAPVPSSCLASKTKCSCYSQQATVMDVPEYLCREIVAKGFFVDFELDRNKQSDQDKQRQAFAHPDAYLVRADSVPVVPDRTGEVHQAPATNDAAGYGVLGARRDEIRRPSL